MKKYTILSAFIRQLKSIKKEGLWYMYPAYLIGPLFAGLTPVLTAVFSQTMTDLIVNSSSDKEIIRSVVTLTAAIAITFAVGHVLRKFL